MNFVVNITITFIVKAAQGCFDFVDKFNIIYVNITSLFRKNGTFGTSLFTGVKTATKKHKKLMNVVL